MPRYSTEKHKAKKGARFQFELLEPRHLFSVNPLESPSSDAPPLELTSTAPQLEQQADQALTNFTWLPMVFAGADKIATVSSSLLLTGDVIVNATANLSIAWSKISGPGNALFGNSSSVSSSVQFDQMGTYELQLTATNAGLTAFDRIFVTVTASNTINIDQAWLNAQGPGPYYLDQAGKNYVLQTDVTTKGTAFAIVAKDVTLDLNGHTITYDNAATIAIPNGSFEQGNGSTATGWNYASAPSASRYQGVWLYNEIYDGAYSLKFSDTKTNQFLKSTTSITLEANATYSLSAMFEYGGQGDFENPGVKGYVRLIGSNGEPTREVYWDQSNWRGIQLKEAMFTTGNAAETYTIEVGITGQATSTKAFYIDDIKIQRTRNFGVAVSPKAWSPGSTPGVSKYGDATNATIKNGTIVQGQNAGTLSHGVFVYAEQGVRLENLDITVRGANSSAILGQDMGTYPITITGNSLTSNVQTITSRDGFDGAVIKGVVGTITNNSINNGPHAGIFTGQGAASVISGNTIKLKAKYTNAFAIIGSRSSQIFNNQVLCGTGDYSAHGIGIVGGTAQAPGRVYDNTIEVQQLPGVNQEYQGIPIGGVFGLQFDNSPGTGSPGATYGEVYGNNVTAYGTTSGYALRITVPRDAVLSIHHNTFRAVATGTGHAAPVSIYGETVDEPGTFDRDDFKFEDNTIVTNDGIVIDSTRVPEMILRRTTFKVTTPIASALAFTPAWNPGTGVHVNLRFIDTIFADETSRNYFEAATANENRVIVTEEWTTTIQVKNASNLPVVGANVTIKDKNNIETFAGTTDANGRVTTVLKQQQMQGAVKSIYNTYNVLVSFGGTSSQQSFSADRTQTFALQLAVSQQSMNQMSAGDSTSLAIQAFETQQFANYRTSNPSEKAKAEKLRATPLQRVKAHDSQSNSTSRPMPAISRQGIDETAYVESVDSVYSEYADFLTLSAIANGYF